MSVLEKAAGPEVRAAVEGAFRRRLLVLWVEELAPAAALVCAGTILLLLLGTDILAGYWLVFLALAGIGWAFAGTRRALLSRYRVAQIVDRRLELHDLVSTAWFLLEGSSVPAELAAPQISLANEAARRIVPAEVFPLRWRRAWAVTALLAVLACGLFLLRYVMTNSLSLHAALVPIDFSFPARVFEKLEKPLDAANRPRPLGDARPTAGETRRADAPRESEQLPKPPVPDVGKPNDRAPGPGSPHGGLPNEAQTPEPGQSQGQAPPDQQAGTDTTQPGAPPKPAGDAPRNAQRPDAKNPEDDPRASSGLMDRMKDALSSLMDKMHPRESSPSAAQTGRNGQEQKPGQQAPSKASDADKQAAARDAQADQQSAAAQAQGEATEKAEAGQSQTADQSADKKGSNMQSGIGRQDGEKQLKEAEQLRAMGKLAEIIGKRSANLTGDATIEASSSQQQLKTQYSGHVARHSDGGGQIDREEIPLAYQQYVREYMQQVHRQADNHAVQNGAGSHP